MRLSPSLLTWLRCFESAARLGKFTRAAAELHLTQGAISQQVRLLEQHLACELFHRFPGRVELTPAGRRLQSELGPALQRIEHAVTAMRTPEGQLHISCAPSFAIVWLVPRLGGFLRLHPELDVRLKAEFQPLDAEAFAHHGLHAAIRYDPFEYSELRAQHLLDEYLLPVASPEYLATREISRLFSESDITLLHDVEPWHGAPAKIEWQNILTEIGARSTDAYRGCSFNLADLALSSARSGEGVAAARLALALDDLEARRLLPVVDRPIASKCRYVFLSTGKDDRRVKAFSKWLREECDSFKMRRDLALDQLLG